MPAAITSAAAAAAAAAAATVAKNGESQNHFVYA
jgi:hypothetical protein